MINKKQLIRQVLPEKKQVPLEGLYLSHQLAGVATRLGRGLVISSYITDINDVIAKADEQHVFQVPAELKNPSDWRLFQELSAQADVVISGAAYLKRFAALGSRGQDILMPFEPQGVFAALGEWRLKMGYKKRSPDLAIIARKLDFTIPSEVVKSGRKIILLTTDHMAESAEANAFKDAGASVIASGEQGVDGKRMIDHLRDEMGYRVIQMASGPKVLALLLSAQVLDLLYITQVQRAIPNDNPASVQTVLAGGMKVAELAGFRLNYRYEQEDVVVEDGALTSQSFLRYDRKTF